MRVLLSSIGSWGDVQPLLALGIELLALEKGLRNERALNLALAELMDRQTQLQNNPCIFPFCHG